MAFVKIIELIGTSDKSWEDAVQQGIEKVASEGRIRGIDVMGFKAVVENNKIVEYRAHMKAAIVKE